ncbi:hypothetical protein [Clostridium sp. Ade.TY]|uniref:hypothetical protein n=1 Tax=Clostridium sp. Ade.TY TaxID=1391647 RepID=UPI00041D5C5B|nr:hypothetical protein [Clostridium sp. Ade.TY]
MKRCIYCDREIEIKYLLKQKRNDIIKCPYCTKELKVNKISKLFADSTLILISSLLIIFPIGYTIKIIGIILWIILFGNLIRPLLYSYE